KAASAFGTSPRSVTVPSTHLTSIPHCRVLGSLWSALRTRVVRARSANEDAIGALLVDFIRSCPFSEASGGWNVGRVGLAIVGPEIVYRGAGDFHTSATL